MNDNRIPDSIVQEWMVTKNIIKQFLKELFPTMSEEALDHNAAAVIARLAQANFIIVHAEDQK